MAQRVPRSTRNPRHQIREQIREDLVNHPEHYGGDTTYEVIKVLEAWGLDKNARLFNAVKYIARHGKKRGYTPLMDLQKARWYLDREIKILEEVEKEEP